MITQHELKEVLDYDPVTGIFRWRIDRSVVKKGDIAGHKNKLGYMEIRVNKKLYLGHRLAFMYIHGRFPSDQIDHINHCRHDNRINNLREVDNIDNHKNRPMQSNNKSGVVGVCFDKFRNKWSANIWVDKKKIAIGRYIDKFEAICARKSAEVKYEYHANHGK